MILSWPGPTYGQGQICFFLHLNVIFFWKVDFLNTVEDDDGYHY